MTVRFMPATAEEVIPVVYRAAMDTPGESEKLAGMEIALQLAQGLDIYGIYQDDKPIGGVLFHGQEIHMAVLPEHQGRWLTKAFYRFLGEQYRLRGALVAYADAKPAQAFIRRFSTAEAPCGDSIMFDIKPPFRRPQ